MKVAAVVPHWNRAPLLRTLLDNLKLQTRPFDEVIVVDNGSTDDSLEVARAAGAQVIELERNFGFAPAVNRGIGATDADFIAILNNDVTLDPYWLDRLLRAMEPVTEEQVRAHALAQVERDLEGTLAEYTRRFGNVLNADHAAELFPDYAATLESRAKFRVAVHPAAQRVRDELFARALANPLVHRVVFTAGGNGAGKTSGDPLGDVVYDSTLNNASHAMTSIGQCLAAGKVVEVQYTFRPITEAFGGVLHRAATQGRTVSLLTVIKTHTGAAETSAAIHATFAEDPRVTMRFIDNSAPAASIGDIALTQKEDYAGKRDELYRLLEAKRSGLPQYLYEATAGPGAGSSGRRERTTHRGQSQQTSPEAAPAPLAFATGKILSSHDHTVLDGTWDEISRAACAVRIGNGQQDGPQWNSQRPIRMSSMTACLIRRDVMAEVGPLDERFGSYLEDVDFGLRCAKGGFQGVYEPGAVTYHEGSATWGAWSPDTVRQLARNQVLLTMKHFDAQPRWPILAGQLLWGLLALRHGCWSAWRAGRREGQRLAIGNDTPDPTAFARVLQESEREILRAHKRDRYWRLYSWLAPLR